MHLRLEPMSYRKWESDCARCFKTDIRYQTIIRLLKTVLRQIRAVSNLWYSWCGGQTWVGSVFRVWKGVSMLLTTVLLMYIQPAGWTTMLFSYVPFGVTVMVLGCPDYLQLGQLYTHISDHTSYQSWSRGSILLIRPFLWVKVHICKQ